MAELWRTDRAALQARAAEAVRYLRLNAGTAPGASLGEAELRGALDQLGSDFDPRWGGFGGAPKFPPSASLSLLLRCHANRIAFDVESIICLCWGWGPPPFFSVEGLVVSLEDDLEL